LAEIVVCVGFLIAINFSSAVALQNPARAGPGSLREQFSLTTLAIYNLLSLAGSYSREA